MKAKILKFSDGLKDTKKTVDLSDQVFSVENISMELIKTYIDWQRAKARDVVAHTKERSEIKGSSRKLFRQKGTGSARTGNMKSPIKRGGGVAFGPGIHGNNVPNYAFKLNKKVKKAALRNILTLKNKNDQLIIVDDIDMKKPSLKEVNKNIKAAGINNALIVSDKAYDNAFVKSVSNIKNIDYINVDGLNVYDIAKKEQLVIDVEVVAKIQDRLS